MGKWFYERLKGLFWNLVLSSIVFGMLSAKFKDHWKTKAIAQILVSPTPPRGMNLTLSPKQIIEAAAAGAAVANTSQWNMDQQGAGASQGLSDEQKALLESMIKQKLAGIKTGGAAVDDAVAGGAAVEDEVAGDAAAGGADKPAPKGLSPAAELSTADAQALPAEAVVFIDGHYYVRQADNRYLIHNKVIYFEKTRRGDGAQAPGAAADSSAAQSR